MLNRTMSEKTRLMILEVADGQMKVVPLLHHFYKMKRRDDCLAWLIKNNIKGQKLQDLFMSQNRSIIHLLSFVLMKVEKESKMRGLIGGKDYRCHS